MLRYPALWAISAYQRHLSPRKGYSCAYRIAHGGTGCSGFAKQAIQQQGLIAATPAIKQRFAACKQAALNLSAQSQTGKDKKSQKKGRWYGACDFCSGFADPFLCSRGKGSNATSECTPDCAPDCCSP